MKDDVYPGDIKAIPVKRLPPAAQQPYIDLARERHRLWAEITALAKKQEGTGERRRRIAEIGAEIDGLARALYQPKKQAMG